MVHFVDGSLGSFLSVQEMRLTLSWNSPLLLACYRKLLNNKENQ